MEELHLGLTLSTTTYYHNNNNISQLIFSDHNEDQTSSSCSSTATTNPPPTLSLLPLHHSDHDPVGWPPVNYRRKIKLGYNHDDDDENHVKRNYVKVKMEGVGIARKVNLTTYHSFHALNQTLMRMFAKCDVQPYDLVYQDKEGDWLLAQDVSWRSFIQCAQRLKLLKRR